MYGIGTINTPGQRLIDPRMRLSNALMAGSVQRRPDAHWMQGLGRMAQALAGTYLSNLSAQDQQAANAAMMTGLSPETVSREPVANPQIPELESEAQTALGAAQDHMNQFGGVDNQGLGFSMVQDAQNLMRRAGELPEMITPEPTVTPGSMSRAMMMLKAMGPDNIFAQNMFQQLAQQKMLQDREQKLYERGRSDSLSDYERNLSDKREDTVNARNFQREMLEGDREYNLNLAKNKRLYDYLLLKDKRAYDQEIAELQRQGNMEDAKALIDYKNANPAPVQPVAGRDIPLSPEVLEQKRSIAQAGAMQLDPLQQERRVKLQRENAQATNQQKDTLASVDRTIRTARELLSHPGREAATGLSSWMSAIPGTDARGFAAKLETFKSQNFLPAVQQLKGMGQLSNAEGMKLEASIGALDPSMKEEEFASSLRQILGDLEAARQRMPGSINNPPLAGNDPLGIR